MKNIQKLANTSFKYFLGQWLTMIDWLLVFPESSMVLEMVSMGMKLAERT